MENQYLWAVVRSPGWKNQFVPTKFLNQLRDDMFEREASEINFETTEEAFIDCPGMISVDRSYQSIRIDTLQLSIPTLDFLYFLLQLRLLRKRTFKDGQEYYKLHGWLACIIFTTEQRDLILSSMEEMRSAVEVLADRENEMFCMKMDEIEAAGHIKRIKPLASC